MTHLLFETPFWGLRGNVRTTPIARWKALCRLPIRYYCAFVGSSYGWDVMSWYGSNSVLFRGGGSLWAQILGGREVALNQCWCQKTRVFLLSHSEDPVIIRLDRVPACDGRTDKRTDRRMDRRNCCRYYSALHCKQCGRAVKKWQSGRKPFSQVIWPGAPWPGAATVTKPEPNYLL